MSDNDKGRPPFLNVNSENATRGEENQQTDYSQADQNAHYDQTNVYDRVGQKADYKQASQQATYKQFGQGTVYDQAAGQQASYGPAPQSPAYGQGPAYGQPAAAYGQGPAYGQPAAYGQSPAYSQSPSYGQGPAYGQAAQSPAYGQGPAYGQPVAAYSQSPAYGQAAAYGQDTQQSYQAGYEIAAEAPTTDSAADPTADGAADDEFSKKTRKFRVRKRRNKEKKNSESKLESDLESKPKDRNKSQGKGGSFVFGLIGGIVGAAAIAAVLLLTGIINMPINGVEGNGEKGISSSGNNSSTNVTINTSSEDATIAEAVAVKCLPSVVSVIVETSEGTALGSGVIVDNDGNIITNYHVIEDATEIYIDNDGKNYSAEVVGSDSSSDIAVIKADLGDDTVTPIEVGDSDKLVVGDWVMTIGSPFGLDQSVSTGIVSALYRSTLLSSTSGTTVYANLIQIDAAINQGNSGGALVNDQGQLVGINTLLESTSGDFSGIGFSIPGNYAVSIANKIIAGEKVTHAYIGLSLSTVNSQSAEIYNLPVSQGAYVAEVTTDGPAYNAGIEVGDIITAIDGEEISSADGVIIAIRSHDEGDVVEVTYNRDGTEQTTEVTLGNDEALQEQQALESSQSEDIYEYYNPFDPFS